MQERRRRGHGERRLLSHRKDDEGEVVDFYASLGPLRVRGDGGQIPDPAYQGGVRLECKGTEQRLGN